MTLANGLAGALLYGAAVAAMAWAERAGTQRFIAKPVTNADLLRDLGPLAAGPRLH